MHVCGRHYGSIEFAGNFKQTGPHPPFHLQSVIHDFNEETPPSEDVLKIARHTEGVVELSQPQSRLNRTRRATRAADQACGIS